MISRRTAIASALASAVTGTARASVRPRIGLVLPLTGVQGGVAAEILAGYQLAVQVARHRGIDIDLVVEDDASDAARTAAVVRRFGSDASILAVSGVVGTPHAAAAIPAARDTLVPLIGIRSGASALRDGGPFVYHLRASYESEISRMVNMFAETTNVVSVIFSQDAFGVGALAHIGSIAAKRGVRIAASVAAERNGSDIHAAVRRAIDPSNGAKGLVILMITQPAVSALRLARSQRFLGPTFTMSFTATSELNAAGPDVVRGLGLVSAFPVPRSASDEATVAFRAAATAAARPTLMESVTAYEGFVYGTTIARAIQKCDGPPSRESLMRCMVTQPRISVGGAPLEFDQTMAARRYLEVLYFDSYGTLRA